MNQDPKDINIAETPTNLPDETATPVVKKGINLVLAISIAVVVAAILAGGSLFIFMRSDTRDMIRTNESAENAKTEESLSDAPDETSALTSDDLNGIEQDVASSAASINSGDFGSSEVTDSALGL